MIKAQAAHRLGVHETQIRTLEEHPAGHLVTLRSGVVMLVSETTARVYLPEVDDLQPDLVGEDGPERTKLPADGAVVAAKPKATPKRKTSGGSGS